MIDSTLTLRADGESIEDLRDRVGAHTGDDGSDGEEHDDEDVEEEEEDLDADGDADGDDDDKKLPERRRCSVTRTGMSWLQFFFDILCAHATGCERRGTDGTMAMARV